MSTIEEVDYLKPVDVYDKDRKFIQTFPSRSKAAEFIGCLTARISLATASAAKGKGSQVYGYWICNAGESPVYKKPNTLPGRQVAKQANLGKKRPEHSAFMKQKMLERQDRTLYEFNHKSNVQFIGTRRQLIETHPTHHIKNSELGRMIRGDYKSHRGWSLNTEDSK